MFAAAATLAALVVFPANTESERYSSVHSYGTGYMITWSCVPMYGLCALLLSLDDIVRSVSLLCSKDDPNSRRL